MPDYLRALEFACKTARSLIVGRGAPTLPGPLDDGDLLAVAEESRESWEPNEIVRSAFDEERLELLKSDPEAFFRGHKQRPWWSAEAVAAHQRALDTPLSATFDDNLARGGCTISECRFCPPKSPAVSATDSAVEDPPGGNPPPPGADSLTHLAQCLRDAVGDYYDYARNSYKQFPFWHDDGLIDAFDWESATNAFLEDVRRAFDPKHPQHDNKFQK